MRLHGHRVIYHMARQRSTGRADPRHGQLLAPLARGRAGPRRPLYGDRPRPDRPRRLRHAARGLLARSPRLEHPRPARRARRRPRHDRRTLARRRRGDAVLLPVPPAHRAPRAHLLRRAGPRGQPAAAQRHAAGRLRAAVARRPSRACWPACAAAASSCARPDRAGASTCRRSPAPCARSSSPARAPRSCTRCARSSTSAASASAPPTGCTCSPACPP